MIWGMDCIKIKLDSIPITINQAYKTIMLKKGSKKIPMRAATGDLKVYKAQVKNQMLFKRVNTSALIKFKDEKLVLHIKVSTSDWITKAGTIRKNDVTNRIKTLEDAVFEALGIDDSQVWTCLVHKAEETQDQTHVFIETKDSFFKRHPTILDIFL